MSATLKQYAAVKPAGNGSITQRVTSWMTQAWQQHRTRRQLATLDDRALADIGISRAQAHFVAEGPVWRNDLLR